MPIEGATLISTEFGNWRSRFIRYVALPTTPAPTSRSTVTLPCCTVGSRNLRSNTIADVVFPTAAGGVIRNEHAYPKPLSATCGQFVIIVGTILTCVVEDAIAVSSSTLRTVAPG